MEFLDQTNLLDLAGLIYEAATEPAQWMMFLGAFGQSPDAKGVAMWLQNLADASAMDGKTHHPCLPDLHRAEADGAGASRLKGHIRQPHGESETDKASQASARPNPAGDPKLAEFNEDRFNAHDLSVALGSLVDKHDTLGPKFRALNSARVGPDSEDELELYRLLIAHLQKASLMRRRLSRTCLPGQAALTSLELLPTAIWLLGTEGDLLYANPAAQVVIQRGDVLTLATNGCLSARVPNENKRLTEMIRKALLPGQDLGQVPHGNRVFMGSDGATLHVLVMSLGQSRMACGAATAVVFATDPTAIPPILKDNLHRFYELTSAEACLASALVAGETVGRYADRTGISKETARTHLKRIMSKIGARRQVDVIRMIVSGPAFIALPTHKSAV